MQPPGRGHYDFARYSHPPRWASYHYQLRTILTYAPKSLLEVGVGDGICGAYLRRNTGIEYRSLDLVVELAPSVAGRVDALPFAEGAFDMVAAFQVLEHLPFAAARKALAESARVARRFVVLSVPSARPTVRLGLKLPHFRELRTLFKLPVARTRIANPEHCWELGARGLSGRRFEAVLGERFELLESFAPFENPYHHFFALRVR